MATMNPGTLTLRALLLLGLWNTGRRSLASAPELHEQPQKIGKPVPAQSEWQQSINTSVLLYKTTSSFHLLVNYFPPQDASCRGFIFYICGGDLTVNSPTVQVHWRKQANYTKLTNYVSCPGHPAVPPRGKLVRFISQLVKMKDQ